MDVALFYLTQAFDRVCQRRLILKLHSAERNNQIVGLIKASYAERTQ